MNTLENFVAHVKQKGMARPHQFVVEFAFPKAIRNLPATEARVMSLMCHSAQYPERDISTNDALTINTAHVATPQTTSVPSALQLQFYVDGSFGQRIIIDEWVSSAVDVMTNSVSYLDDITTEIRLHIMNDEEIIIRSIAFKNAWLQSTIQEPLQYDRSSGVFNTTCSFKYSHWEPTASPTGSFIRAQNKSTWEKVTSLYRTVKPYVAARVPGLGKVEQTINTAKRVPQVIGSIFR